ncbi:hypothetical protein ACIHEJ_32795 [Streptomyces sp. NPDC052301]|uniref:hypothetical protein n=1 Tax=Streptomyces sp. NPDC052301 TaxID=3365687 RepID=UPI0037CF5071
MSEQIRVDGMYGLLDERLAQARAQLAEVRRRQAGGPGEAYAREVEAGRLTALVRRPVRTWATASPCTP